MSPILLLLLVIVARQPYAADAIPWCQRRCQVFENACLRDDLVHYCKLCADKCAYDEVKTKCRNKECNLLRNNCNSTTIVTDPLFCQKCTFSSCHQSIKMDCYNVICENEKSLCQQNSPNAWETAEHCTACLDACRAWDNDTHQCHHPLVSACKQLHGICKNTKYGNEIYGSGHPNSVPLPVDHCPLCARSCNSDQTKAVECRDKSYQLSKQLYQEKILPGCRFAVRDCNYTEGINFLMIHCSYCLDKCPDANVCRDRLDRACPQLWHECKSELTYGHYLNDACNLCHKGCEQKNKTMALDCLDHIK